MDVEVGKRPVASSGPAMSRYLPDNPGWRVLARIAPGIHHFLHKRMIRLTYDMVSLFETDDAAAFMNWGFRSTRPDDPDPVLITEHGSSRHAMQLYFRVARPVALAGLDVLEVGCGRGGGASFLMNHFKPRTLTGVDFSSAAVAFCNRRHAREGLTFRQGDAENLPCAADSFDVVVNVESSHCYGSMERFLAEVVRVLRPGGHFLFADFRDQEQVNVLRAQLLAAGLTIQEEARITSNVLRSLEFDNDDKMAEIKRKKAKRPRPLLEQVMAVKGSPMYEAFCSGACEYLRFVLRKETIER